MYDFHFPAYTRAQLALNMPVDFAFWTKDKESLLSKTYHEHLLNKGSKNWRHGDINLPEAVDIQRLAFSSRIISAGHRSLIEILVQDEGMYYSHKSYFSSIDSDHDLSQDELGLRFNRMRTKSRSDRYANYKEYEVTSILMMNFYPYVRYNGMRDESNRFNVIWVEHKNKEGKYIVMEYLYHPLFINGPLKVSILRIFSDEAFYLNGIPPQYLVLDQLRIPMRVGLYYNYPDASVVPDPKEMMDMDNAYRTIVPHVPVLCVDLISNYHGSYLSAFQLEKKINSNDSNLMGVAPPIDFVWSVLTGDNRLSVLGHYPHVVCDSNCEYPRGKDIDRVKTFVYGSGKYPTNRSIHDCLTNALIKVSNRAEEAMQAGEIDIDGKCIADEKPIYISNAGDLAYILPLSQSLRQLQASIFANTFLDKEVYQLPRSVIVNFSIIETMNDSCQRTLDISFASYDGMHINAYSSLIDDFDIKNPLSKVVNDYVIAPVLAYYKEHLN